jgi:hypothetical protein
MGLHELFHQLRRSELRQLFAKLCCTLDDSKRFPAWLLAGGALRVARTLASDESGVMLMLRSEVAGRA